MVGALAALPFAGLGSCCLRRFPEPLLGETPRPESLRRILVPERIQRSERKPRFAIDVHAHFFNASDVNVGGYVEHCIAHSRSEPLRSFIRSMAPVLDNLAGEAKTAAAEYRELIDKAGRVQPAPTGESTSLDLEINAKHDEIAQRLYDEMRRKGADVHYLRAKETNLKQLGVGAAQAPRFSPDVIREAMETGAAIGTFAAPASAAVATSGDADGVLRFAGYMLKDRWMNLRTYAQAYSISEGAFGIDAAFGALVDFDYWLDCPAHSARRDQMKVHSLIAYLSGGYMLPLIGYNPWTDIKRDGESLALVQDAIRNYGYIGVKIYPPTGFYAYGNADNPVNTPLPRPKDLKELDAKLAAMFDWCAENDVPVMGHSNHSMGRDDASDAFGGTVGWNALEARYDSQAKAPTVSLSHFGGDAAEDGQWPTQFGALMAQYPQRAIYGDLAYWSNARMCALASNAGCDALRARIQSAKDAFPQIEDRLMYGSDWLMLSQERDWSRYPDLLAVATDTLLAQEKLYYGNAMRCFGLGEGGASRTRIVESLKSNDAPGWLDN